MAGTETMPNRLFVYGRKFLELIAFIPLFEPLLTKYKDRDWTKYVPNIISVSRLLLIFLALDNYIWGYIQKDITLLWTGIFFVYLAAISDIWDGFLAELWDVKSELGMMLDPIVDKIFSYTGIVCLTILTFFNFFSWISSIILFTATILIGIEFNLVWLNWQNKKTHQGTGKMSGASVNGKIKFTVEAVMIIILAIVNMPSYNFNGIIVNMFFLFMLLISILFAALSRSDYIQRLNPKRT